MTKKIHGSEKKTIVDARSPVTIVPPDTKILKNKKTLPVTTKNQDFRKTEVEITGNDIVEAESKGFRKNLSMLNN